MEITKSTQRTQRLGSATKPGPICTLCGHPERQAIERALVAGEQISGHSGLCERYGLSASATHRHRALHLTSLLRSTLPVDPFGLYEVAREVALRAEEVADRAFEAGDDALTLKAGDARLRAVTNLSDRYGTIEPNAGESAEVVADLSTLARAIAQAARREPLVGQVVCAVLDETGHPGLASQLRAAFPSTAQGEIQ
jgi:hypothetical protein